MPAATPAPAPPAANGLRAPSALGPSRSLSSLTGALQAVGSRSRSKSRRSSFDKAAVPPVPALPTKRSFFSKRPSVPDQGAVQTPAPAETALSPLEVSPLPARRRWKDTRELDLIRAELSVGTPPVPVMPNGAGIQPSPSKLQQAVDLRAPTDLSRPWVPQMPLALSSTGNLADPRPMYATSSGMLSTPTLPRPPRSPGAKGGRALVSVPAEVMIGLETTPYSVLPLPGSPFASHPSTPLPDAGGFAWPSAPPSPSLPAAGLPSQAAAPVPDQVILSSRSSSSAASVYSTPGPGPDTNGPTARTSTAESWEAPSLDHLPSSHSSHPSELPAPPSTAPYFPRESTPPAPGKEHALSPTTVAPNPSLLQSVSAKTPVSEKSPQSGTTTLSKLRSRAKGWSRSPTTMNQKTPAPALPTDKTPSVPTLPSKAAPTSPPSAAKFPAKASVWKWGNKPKDNKGSQASSGSAAPLKNTGNSHSRGRANSLGASAWKALKLPSKEPAAQRAAPLPQ